VANPNRKLSSTMSRSLQPEFPEEATVQEARASEVRIKNNDVFPEERPTVRAPHIAEATILLARRIDRLVEEAVEQLLCAPDDDALGQAVSALLEVRELTGSVLR
jgi:hypothetical protein